MLLALGGNIFTPIICGQICIPVTGDQIFTPVTLGHVILWPDIIKLVTFNHVFIPATTGQADIHFLFSARYLLLFL